MSYIEKYVDFLRKFHVYEKDVYTYSPWTSPHVNDTREGVVIHMRDGSTVIYI